MPKLQRVSGADAIRALERMGFVQVRQRVSHVILVKAAQDGDIGCSVPLHRELAIGTLRSILRQAKISPEDFLNNL